jgi:hypothetical protein
MVNIIARSAYGCAVLLLAAVACLASGNAFASPSQTCPPAFSSATTYKYGQVVSSGGTNYQSINNSNTNHQPPNATYWTTTGAVLCQVINIQPIDVCASGATQANPTGCAPFNTTTKTPNPWTSTGPIGFVDPTTGKDVTRTIWNKIGIDINWLPITPYPNTTYQTITITCTLTGNECVEGTLASPQFQALTQQPGISTGTAPTPPLNSSPYALDMFFINKFNPPTPGRQALRRLLALQQRHRDLEQYLFPG